MKALRLIVLVLLGLGVASGLLLLADDLIHWLTPPTTLYPTLYWVLLDLRGLGLVAGVGYIIARLV